MDEDVKFNELYEELSDTQNKISKKIKEFNKIDKHKNNVIIFVSILFGIIVFAPLALEEFNQEESFIRLITSSRLNFRAFATIVSILIFIPLFLFLRPKSHQKNIDFKEIKADIFHQILNLFNENLKLNSKSRYTY